MFQPATSMPHHTGVFCSSRGMEEGEFVGAGDLGPLRLRRQMCSTLLSAYTFEQQADDMSFDFLDAFGLNFESRSDAKSLGSPISNQKEESAVSTTTGSGSDVSDGSVSDGSASDHMPKSTTSCGSSGGSDGSDSDVSPTKNHFMDSSLPPASRPQRRPPCASKHGRASIDPICQKKGSQLLENSPSCPAIQTQEIPMSARAKGEGCVMAAREACASARGLGNRLGSELSTLDDDMMSLAAELRVLRSFIVPRDGSGQ